MFTIDASSSCTVLYSAATSEESTTEPRREALKRSSRTRSEQTLLAYVTPSGLHIARESSSSSSSSTSARRDAYARVGGATFVQRPELLCVISWSGVPAWPLWPQYSL